MGAQLGGPPANMYPFSKAPDDFSQVRFPVPGDPHPVLNGKLGPQV